MKNNLDFGLKDKVAIVAGGGSNGDGIGNGRASSILLAEAGAKVLVVDLNKKSAQNTVDLIKNNGGDAFAIDADLTSSVECKNVVNEVMKKWKRLDILDNNIGIASNTSVVNENEKYWDKVMNVNLKPMFLMSKYSIPEMINTGNGGVIINISSDLGLIAPDNRIYNPSKKLINVKPVSYSVIKHGIIGLTKYLATYWADKNIRTNCLCPGGVYENQDKAFVKKISKLIPLKRMARVDEYKGAIQFLCSDASSYMNGSNLVIDGGRTIW